MSTTSIIVVALAAVAGILVGWLSNGLRLHRRRQREARGWRFRLGTREEELRRTREVLQQTRGRLEDLENRIASGAPWLADTAGHGGSPATGGPAAAGAVLLPPGKDDLKRISGVGEFEERILNALGYRCYRAVTAWTDEDIEAVADAAHTTPSAIRAAKWVEQARALHDEKHHESA